MSIRTIKDPTFNIYAKGGNVEKKKQTYQERAAVAVSKRYKRSRVWFWEWSFRFYNKRLLQGKKTRSEHNRLVRYKT